MSNITGCEVKQKGAVRLRESRGVSPGRPSPGKERRLFATTGFDNSGQEVKPMRFARRPARVKQALIRPFIRTKLSRPGRVLLTFDDGPDTGHTPAVLDRLQAAGATAAFFLIGNRTAAAPHLPTAIARAGHIVGNHTFSHRRLGLWELGGAVDELARCQELLPAGANWLRPPFGRLTPGVWVAARRLGLEVVTWTLDSNDWQCRCEADAMACATEVLACARPGDTILFHDNHRWIGPILDVVLPELVARGLVA